MAGSIASCCVKCVAVRVLWAFKNDGTAASVLRHLLPCRRQNGCMQHDCGAAATSDAGHARSHALHTWSNVVKLGQTAGTYANLVKQAKSKQKILDKMVEAGLTQPVQRERTFEFQFPGALWTCCIFFVLDMRTCDM